MASSRRRAVPAPLPPGALVGAIDPGLRPGAVQIDATTGALLRASHRIEPWVLETPWDLFAVEGQWYYGRRRGTERGAGGAPDPDVNDLLKLAFRAGFTLACVPAARSLRIPPKVWRGPYGNLSKTQVQQKIANNLTAAERRVFIDIPAARHGDVLDAIGIARGALRVAPTTTEFDWTLTP